MIAQHLSRIEWIDLDLGAAILAVCAQVLKALQVSALTLPVTDLIFDEFEGSRLAKIRNRENRFEHRLKADGLTFLRNEVHLKKSVI